MSGTRKVHWSAAGGNGTPCAFVVSVSIRKHVTRDPTEVTCLKCLRYLLQTTNPEKVSL
jgi:hypothetical protein